MSKDKLSPSMVTVLRNVEAGRGYLWGARGRSEYGARHSTAAALRRRGLLDGYYKLTAKGRMALAALAPAA